MANTDPMAVNIDMETFMEQYSLGKITTLLWSENDAHAYVL